ncbi:DUF551 domain-containing protein [Avibacterium paragallinarum]|nr:DUF551 domain-containing protein [Avibacterium paragallinarum]
MNQSKQNKVKELKMKPFDLNAALDGKPVQLRDGRKAFVKAVIEQPKGLRHYSVIGYARNGIHVEFLHWGTNGDCIPGDISDDDIVGMWEEPKPKRFINGIEVPEPVTLNTWENGRKYWYVRFTAPECVQDDPFYKYSKRDERMISQGLVFKTKKGAEAMMKALLNYNVEYKNDDNAYANNGWIDINKQLPPLGTKVIGRCVIDGKVLILIIVKKLVGSEYWFSPVNIYGTFDDKAVDVTHWQPLPKLPQA